MKATAHQGRTASSESPIWNAFGYSVSFFVELEKNDNRGLDFNCFFCIYAGSSDSELGWPFSKTVVFKIIHPKDKSKDIFYKVEADNYRESDCFHRPTGTSNVGIGFASLCTAGRLHGEGFIRDNKLHMLLQVKP
uniref:Putative tumor necrosis factor receptor n=1 Tax=Ixodes ricinus TaxID=34613 RepID=A0A0K8RB52_IXORI